MQLKVHAPTGPKFTGVVAGVAFAHGVATIDSEADRRALAYFRRKGYKTEALDAPDEPADTPAEVKRPGKSGSKAQWVAYAVAQGVSAEKADALTTAQLVDQIDALIAEAAKAAETENGGPQ